jgi:4'-phosphopantetheinyl transferase
MSSIFVWENPPEGLDLLFNEVHVWRASLDLPSADVQSLLAILSEEERARAQRFRSTRDGQRSIASRGLLRLLLARYLAADPSRIRFRYNREGKPKLADEAVGRNLRFNVSHSQGLALFAFTRGHELGVDLERMDRAVSRERIPEHFFSPRECAALRALPVEQQPEAFFACWTRKEAYIKAKGKGLAIRLDQFDVSLAPGEPAALLETAEGSREALRWSLHTLSAAPGYAGALAIEGQGSELHGWQLDSETMLLTRHSVAVH